MTIKIQAYQRQGFKTNSIIDEFEFCCWVALKKWLDNFSSLHDCSECKQDASGRKEE